MVNQVVDHPDLVHALDRDVRQGPILAPLVDLLLIIFACPPIPSMVVGGDLGLCNIVTIHESVSAPPKWDIFGPRS